MSSNANTPPARNQIAYFQRLRCWGALAVVLLHILSLSSDRIALDVFGYMRAFWTTEFEFLLTRWAVPVFFMISGALLLDPARSIGWKKSFAYARRMLSVLATFGLAFALIKEYVLAGAFSIDVLRTAVLDVLSNNGWRHMWYVYVLIGIYLILPLLRAYVATASERDLRILLAVLYVCTLLIPTICELCNIQIHKFVEFPFSVFYVFLGYYAHTYLRLNRFVIAAGVGAIAIATLANAWSIFGQNQYGYWFYEPGLGLIVWWSLLLFMLFKHFLNGPLNSMGLVSRIADCSFGIYILHPIMLHIVTRVLNWDVMMFPPVLYELMVWGVAVVGTTVLVWLLRLIPPVRRIL